MQGCYVQTASTAYLNSLRPNWPRSAIQDRARCIKMLHVADLMPISSWFVVRVYDSHRDSHAASSTVARTVPD
eukprot:3429832-Pyramimonas_sp.AAC.1